MHKYRWKRLRPLKSSYKSRVRIRYLIRKFVKGVEVFFKVCKSYLNLSRECNSLSYDAMTAHTAVVFTRYMMLSLESREGSVNRSLGELFLYFSDEMSDITWIQAFRMLLQMFRTILNNNTELSDDKIDELVDTFMNTLPALLKAQLQAA